MRLRILWALFCLLNTAVLAQDFQWAQSIGGSSTENVQELAVFDGKVYVSGQFFGSVDFDPSTGTDFGLAPANGSAYIAQFDTLGGYQWKISFEDNPTAQAFIADMAKDTSGNLVVLGSHIGDIDLDPGSATVTPNVNASSFVAIYSPSGNYIRHFEYAGFFLFTHIRIDSLNNLFIAGSFDVSLDANPFAGTDMANPINGNKTAILSKIKLSNNQYQWSRFFGGGLCSGEDIALSPNGNITLAGVFEDSIDLNPSASTQIAYSVGDADVFMAQLNSNGSFIGSNVMGSGFFDGIFDVKVNSNGEFFLSIVHYDPIEMNGMGASTVVQPLFPASGASDIVLGKYDSGLNLIWAKQFGSRQEDNLPAISVKYDQIALSGTISGNVSLSDFNTTNYFDLSSYPSNKAMYVLVLDDDGNLERSFLMEDFPINSNEIGLSANNELYIVGGYSDTCDFDPGPLSSNLVASNGDEGYVMKLKFQSPPNSISNSDHFEWKIYPNPATEQVKIYWGNASMSNLQVLNMFGQIIYESDIQMKEEAMLPIENWVSGQYIIIIKNSDAVYSQKLKKL